MNQPASKASAIHHPCMLLPLTLVICGEIHINCTEDIQTATDLLVLAKAFPKRRESRQIGKDKRLSERERERKS